MSRLFYCPTCLTTFANAGAACPNLACSAQSPDPWPALLTEGDILDRTYKITRRLAGGSAGMTYLGRELGDGDVLVGPPLAIKVLYAQRDSGPFLRRLATEAQVLQGLQHPHIVECLGFVHRAGRPPYLITRFEAGGTLVDHINRVGPLPPHIAATTVFDLIDALRVAHQAGVVHRDLKPANVLLRTKVSADQVPNLKIADFGIAKVQGGVGALTSIGAFVGTPEYAAPEQLLGLEAAAPADLFSAGSVLWFLLTGRQPFHLSQRHDPVHCHGELIRQLPPQLPVEVRATDAGLALQAVIDGLLTPTPKGRWTAARAQAALEDAAEIVGTALPAQTAAVGATGTLFVEDPNTFIWDGDPPAQHETIVAPVEVDPSPVPPPSAAPAPADEPEWTPIAVDPRPPSPPPQAVGSTMEGLFGFDTEPPPPATLPGAHDAFDSSQPRADERVIAPEQAAELDADTPWQAPVELPHDPMALLAVVGRDEHPDAVAERLGTWHADDIGHTLRQAKKHPDADTRSGAAKTVVLLGLPRHISVARGLLRDPVAAVRIEAAKAIGAIGTGSALMSLKRLENDASAEVRAAVQAALAKAAAEGR